MGEVAVTTEEPEDGLSRLNAFVQSLRERQVFRVAAAYTVAAWLVIQVIDIIGPAFDIPDWVMRAAIVVSVAGFAAIFAVFPLLRTGGRGAALRHGRRIMISAMIIGLVGAAALLAWRTMVATEDTRIAVLPFADLSPNRDKSYLAEGVSEEILSALAKVPEMRVVGRATASAIRNEAGDPAGLKSRLGITHLLEGSVRTAGTDLRLAVRLIKTADGTEEWSQDFEGSVDDIFGFQDRVAKIVAARLSNNRAEETTDTLTSSDAYSLFLAARQIARTRTEPELKRAYGIALRLLRAKPEYAPGLSLLAELTFMLSDAPNSYGSIPEARARRQSQLLAQRAIALAPNDAHGYAALGLVSSGKEAVELLDKAIELDPARSELYLWKALEYDDQGRYSDAIASLRRAVEIDPLWVGVVNRLAIDLAGAGLSRDAIEVAKMFERRGGEKASVGRIRTNIALMGGDLSSVVIHGMATLRENPETPYVPRYVAKSLAFMGFKVDRAVLQKIDDLFPRLLWSEGIAGAAAAAPPGADVWQMPSSGFYIFALGAKRDWPRLVSLYDLRSDKARFCNVNEGMGPVFVTALRAAGRAQDADSLLACLSNSFESIRTPGPRYFETVDGAQVAALRGKQDLAFRTLEQAVKYGWSGLSPRLTDYPAFDGLMASPRYAATQRLLDAWIARERRELAASNRSV